jgi:hypothetical protein
MTYFFGVAWTASTCRLSLSMRRETVCTGFDASGGFAKSPSKPSAAVGWVQIAQDQWKKDAEAGAQFLKTATCGG